jgi:hypothetical protein
MAKQMTLEEARARIKARVWEDLAKSDIALKSSSKEELSELVDIVTNAALLEVDKEMDSVVLQVTPQQDAGDDEPDEDVLWEGRPFLSVSTYYIITDERVRIIEGLLGKEREDIELVRIQDLDQQQSVTERILGIGNIVIHSHDPSHPQAVLRNVRDVEAVHETLRRAVINARKRRGLIYREEM